MSADKPLHNAPHTLGDIMDPEWSRAYSRELAVFPTEEVRAFLLFLKLIQFNLLTDIGFVNNVGKSE